MAVPELRKPSRRACEHVCDQGCSVHAERPTSCRAFNCAWLRGVALDEHARPDLLGVMIDYFETRDNGETHLLAFELWQGALDSPAAQALLRALAALHVVTLSRRDGRWSTLGDDHM
jgi:hypothetical protein